MKALKTLERLVGGGASAPPTEQTIAALKADEAAKLVTYRTMLDAAAAACGNPISNLRQWEDRYQLLKAVRIKSLVAAGQWEESAKDTVEKQLSKERTAIEDLERDLGQLNRDLVARHATERAALNAENAERQAELDRQLVAALVAPAPFAEALERLLSVAEEIRTVNDAIARHQPGGQVNRAFVEKAAQYLQRGDVLELAERATRLHFHIVTSSPNRYTWTRRVQ